MLISLLLARSLARKGLEEFKLSPLELPEEHDTCDTSFAMHTAHLWGHDSSLVIFHNGEAGLECKIGKSLWYLLEHRGVVNSHKLKYRVKYKFAGEQGTWIRYGVKM